MHQQYSPGPAKQYKLPQLLPKASQMSNYNAAEQPPFLPPVMSDKSRVYKAQDQLRVNRSKCSLDFSKQLPRSSLYKKLRQKQESEPYEAPVFINLLPQ